MKAKTSESLSPANNRLRRFIVILSVLVAVVIITLVTGLLIINALGGTRHEPVAVAAGTTVKTFATVPGDNAFPTGLARGADGTLYVTAFGSATLYKSTSDGKLAPWLDRSAGITAPGSITVAPDGSLYLLDFTTSNPGSGVGAIKHITPDGRVSIYANQSNEQGLSFLSHLVFDAQGNLYVTFTAKQEVWRYPTTGQGGLWFKLSGVGNSRPQPTGIIFDKVSNALIIADAGSGTVYRVKIKDDGSADQALVLYRQAGLTIQGLSLDQNGRLLISSWIQDNGQVARLSDDGKYSVLAQGFRAPTDTLAVDNAIYVVNSDLPGLVPMLRAKPPFTIDVITETAVSATAPK